MILTVLMAPKSSCKDLLIYTSHVSKWSILAKISGRSVDNHHSMITNGHLLDLWLRKYSLKDLRVSFRQ